MTTTLPRLVVPLFTALAMIGCWYESDAARNERQVTVAAASDLRFAFDELIGEFEQEHPDVKVHITYGSSGNFFAQLSNKAPFDLFFSADVDYPRKLIEQGHARRETEQFYAVGHLVVWVRGDSPLDLETLGANALLEARVRRIAIANPQHAPYGRAAKAALEGLGIYDKVRDKLVLGDNVTQAAQFVESEAADAGLVSLSLALAPAMREKGRYWSIPTDAHPPIEQACVILNWARDPEAAAQFQSFVAGQRGRDLLRRYGFDVPEE